jgi:tRNA-binding EMAP/Myf-like protein
MKNIILILGIVLTGYISNAQDEKLVPPEVKASLTLKYPEVLINKVNWEKIGEYYKADFKAGDKKYEVLMDPKGTWVHSEITLKEIPNEVKDGLSKSEFKSAKINEVEKVENPDLITRYKVDLNKENQEYDILLDQNGKIINKIKI